MGMEVAGPAEHSEWRLRLTERSGPHAPGQTNSLQLRRQPGAFAGRSGQWSLLGVLAFRARVFRLVKNQQSSGSYVSAAPC